MAIQISRLRRWFATGAILVVAIVGGAYYFAKWRIENALKEVPGKIGVEIQQSAQGFSISKSEGGRTIYTIRASKAIQYKQGGRAELHEVAITLYGRDSTRYDQIYGSDFQYDPQSGDVVAQGEVQIDLEANPAGIVNPDQTVPRELKNPIHLKTSGLVFNQKSGDAQTNEKVEFRIPQAQGTAIGASYSARDNTLILHSQVQIDFSGPEHASLSAMRASMTKSPQAIMLDHPRLRNSSQTSEADSATLFLRKDNTVERLLAQGNVQADTEGASASHLRSAKLEVFMGEHRDALRSAVFSGDVHMETTGDQPMQGNAGRVVLNFTGKSLLRSVHTEDHVKLMQHQKPGAGTTNAQDVEITGFAVDFLVSKNHRMQHAQTLGAAQITLRPTEPGPNAQQTLVTAAKFEAHFDKAGILTSVHGAPDTRIVTVTPGEADRVSTSDGLDAVFRPGKGIESITQQGNFAYVDGERKAWCTRAVYTPATHMLQLYGSPRVQDAGLTTTANSMRLDRSTGDALAEGEVKSTYSDLKPQPNGALLASASPIHVTARSMTAHRSPGVALYSGGGRLWQDANVVEAPSIQFDRNHRSVVAQASTGQPVAMVLMQTDKSGKSIPVKITSSRLTYADHEREAHFEGGVTAKWTDMTVTSTDMDVFLQARGQAAATTLVGPGKLDRIVAQNQVVIVQPNRRATGDQLVYTAAEDKFVMTGGPPSIFDAEQGKITGVSLTLFRRDDRVLIEGDSASPVVTQTRVAR